MKKIILSLFITTLVVLGVVQATKAYFSNQGTSSGNTFSAGTLDLKLSDDNETDQDNVVATWTKTDMVPGNSATATLNLKNTGTIAGNHIEIATANTVTDALSGPGVINAVPMDQVLELITLTYDGSDLLGSIPDNNGNTLIDLDDLEAYIFDNLSLSDSNNNHPLVMQVRFHPTLGLDQHQGDSVISTLTVTLNQVVSQ